MQRSVCDWLEARKGLKVQHNWVKACLEWIEQEEGGGVPMASLREMVYKQLLHADLRDVVVQPCIPASVPQQQTTTITGHFVVQVDSLIDVGAAAYAQLQKTKGQSLDDFDTKKNFEPKPTRLLLLSLTDGVTDFQAMEYHPIPQLTTDLTPGAKLVLRGTIGCRLGTLLLTGDQVELLGGGVESLAETNQQSRVLARAL
jgi:RecQ-mediated genome instability protein 1